MLWYMGASSCQRIVNIEWNGRRADAIIAEDKQVFLSQLKNTTSATSKKKRNTKRKKKKRHRVRAVHAQSNSRAVERQTSLCNFILL